MILHLVFVYLQLTLSDRTRSIVLSHNDFETAASGSPNKFYKIQCQPIQIIIIQK